MTPFGWAAVATCLAAVPESPRPWLPVQGSASFGLLAGDSSAVGANFYLGYTSGAAYGDHRFASGPFWGIGLGSTVGRVQLDVCGDERRCATRWALGPAFRAGWAFGHGRDEVLWPDTFVYAQLTPYLGAAHVDPAPLAPSFYSRQLGARLDIGLTSVSWTGGAFNSLKRSLFDLNQPNEAASAAVIVSLLALANHLSLSFEVVEAPVGVELRGGFAIGSGF
jgi:hypothetical protein